MEVEGYDFEGPFEADELPEKGGVYLVMAGGSLIDCGRSKEIVETDNSIKKRIAYHDREDCWDDKRNGRPLSFYVCLTNSKFVQRTIERDIRDNNDFPCGKQ